MAKSNRTCFGKGMCLHIGPCCDFWADDGMCVCDPVDAAEYPHGQRLYIAGNISGFSSPNIRTIFPDGHDDVYTFDSGAYCWVYWDWGSSTIGTVKFELRDGSTVKATRSTHIATPPPLCTGISATAVQPETGYDVILGAGWRNDKNVETGFRPVFIIHADGVEYRRIPIKDIIYISPGYTHTLTTKTVFDMPGVYTISVEPNPNNFPAATINIAERTACVEGTMRAKSWCWDGTIIYKEICRDGKWVPSGVTCGNRVCKEGEKRGEKTCADGTVIHEEICHFNKWVPTGETCPTMPVHGEKRYPTTCWDGSVIHAEKYDATLKQWVPTGEMCPPKPECTSGDKKAGYICEDGKWVPYTPPVVPPVEPPVAPPKYLTPAEADERVRAGLPCYIKCTLPILDMLPGIPYFTGCPILPGFTISVRP